MLPTIPAELLVAVIWSVACFVAGVGWAAYRALSWVERIRTWAHTTPIESENVT